MYKVVYGLLGTLAGLAGGGLALVKTQTNEPEPTVACALAEHIADVQAVEDGHRDVVLHIVEQVTDSTDIPEYPLALLCSVLPETEEM